LANHATSGHQNQRLSYALAPTQQYTKFIWLYKDSILLLSKHYQLLWATSGPWRSQRPNWKNFCDVYRWRNGDDNV